MKETHQGIKNREVKEVRSRSKMMDEEQEGTKEKSMKETQQDIKNR